MDLHRVTAGNAVVVLGKDAVKAQHLSEEGDGPWHTDTASAGIAWTKDVGSVVTVRAWLLMDGV